MICLYRTLYVADRRVGELRFFDSFIPKEWKEKRIFKECEHEALLQFMNLHCLLDSSLPWSFSYVFEAAQQDGGSDCGVFVAANVYYSLHGRVLSSLRAHDFRKFMELVVRRQLLPNVDRPVASFSWSFDEGKVVSL